MSGSFTSFEDLLENWTESSLGHDTSARIGSSTTRRFSCNTVTHHWRTTLLVSDRRIKSFMERISQNTAIGNASNPLNVAKSVRAVSFVLDTIASPSPTGLDSASSLALGGGGRACASQVVLPNTAIGDKQAKNNRQGKSCSNRILTWICKPSCWKCVVQTFTNTRVSVRKLETWGNLLFKKKKLAQFVIVLSKMFCAVWVWNNHRKKAGRVSMITYRNFQTGISLSFRFYSCYQVWIRQMMQARRHTWDHGHSTAKRFWRI